jgi:uncharacterized protein (TIGR04255 family)
MVAARPGDLPDFENPPVVETVLSIQFEPLSQMRAAHFGLFWEQIRERYPKTEERSSLDPVIERFPEPVRRRVGLQFPVLEVPPLPRFWFIHRNENELIQLQADRFIKNWRKSGEGDAYPHYEKVRDWLEQDFRKFQDFASREKLGTIDVNQCEVTYVNHIVAGEGWASHEDLDKVLTMWKHPGAPFPGKAEDAAFHARFPIRDGSGHPVGRLHADVQAAIRNTDGKPMFVLNLTARGLLGKSTEFLDLGREWIVRSFAEMTTTEMHEVWKRKR